MQSRASIFYQSDHGNIINALFECDWPSGKFISQGYWSISDDSPSVNTNTGLASLLLGSTAGYRVYFHDKSNSVNEIAYTPKNGSWHYNKVVSRHRTASNAIHAAFTGNANISVVVPFDAENVEVMRFNTDETWHICEFHPSSHPLSPTLTLQ
jgi:hypothetical protein